MADREREAMHPGDVIVIEAAELDTLLATLRDRGYETVGPTVRDGAVVYDQIRGSSDLPAGWSDEQDAGRYRLDAVGGPGVFSHAVGPQSWKRYLLPPALVRWRARREDDGSVHEVACAPPPRYAFVGVRPCDLAALLVQDRVLMGNDRDDPDYRARREAVFLLAVNCGFPSGTCFCVSMGTGPRCGPGHDLAVTEITGDGRHELVVEVGTERGAAVAAAVLHRPARRADLEAADELIGAARGRMGRELDTDGLAELLHRHYESPHWEEVATRCLTCANCTMVCPTCFCTTMEDTSDLTGTRTERRRVWDSCFSVEFSYVHGGSVRTSASARYRQWITHKLATWQEQFGVCGCVGCGRCITWCPVGIDITEEARAVRRRERQEERR